MSIDSRADAVAESTEAAASARPRRSGALADPRRARRYWLIVAGLAALAILSAAGVLTWDIPVPVGSDGFWTIVRLRTTTIAVIAVVAFAQAIATVAFQTVTHNRILTPSIMGFEALYRVVQTGFVFAFGAAGVVLAQSLPLFLGQIGVMVGFAVLLYGWLLAGRRGDLQSTLLIGIVIGAGLGALATFMQRLLTPSEFDVLLARLIGSIANADATYLPYAAPLVGVAGGLLWWRAGRLNAMALGRDNASNLGLHHKRETMLVLTLVAVMMAVSTSLVGPMTFLGFLVAMIAYQLADTYDHRYVFPVAWLTGFVVLAGSSFILRHVFYASGSVGIIMELIGGGFFLIYLLRKGRL